MALRLYVDYMSQPSRAVLLFCRVNNIDAEIQLIKLASREHKSPEFLKVNPMGQVPAIDDHGFKLFESHAILRYLATTRHVPDHWYPADPKRRACIDSVLDWHHGNLRRGASVLVFSQVLAPVFGLPVDMKAAEEAEQILRRALKIMEEVWLGDASVFLAGSSEPSIADLSLCCELTQLQLLGEEKLSSLIEGKDRLKKWMNDVEKATSPHFAEVHAFLSKAASKFRQQSQLTMKSDLHVILPYLATTRHVPDHWYPADPKRRACIDSVLD